MHEIIFGSSGVLIVGTTPHTVTQTRTCARKGVDRSVSLVIKGDPFD